MASYHTLHLILPPNRNRIPSLHLSSPSALDLLIHPSVSNITFGSFSLQTEGSFNLPPIEGKHVKIETVTGDVTGSFNVSDHLVLRTVTGDIDAKVTVVPHRHGKRGNHPRRNVSERDHEDEEKDRKRGPPSRGRRDGPDGPKGPRGSDRPHGLPRRDGPDGHDGLRRPPHRDELDGSRGPRGPDDRRHPHDRPHGPHPAYIGAFSSTGSVTLNVHQPPFMTSDVDAHSHTGPLTVNAAKSFKGFFKAGSHVGNVSAVAQGDKEIEIRKQVKGETGGFIAGFVKYEHRRNETKEVGEGDEFEGSFKGESNEKRK